MNTADLVHAYYVMSNLISDYRQYRDLTPAEIDNAVVISQLLAEGRNK